MPIAQQSFFGDWDVYSGPMHMELVLHEDGTYGAVFWGGAQTHWGAWELDLQIQGTLLVLKPQGSNPPALLGFENPQAESHFVVSVFPNQIQLYDALMMRRFVPAPMPAPVSPLPASFFQMPIAPPAPVYSAPPPQPPPPGQSTPITDIWKQILDQDRQTGGDILAANASAYKDMFKDRADLIAKGSQAGHDFATKFSNTLNPRRF
jgi:hypothetical protein